MRFPPYEEDFQKALDVFYGAKEPSPEPCQLFLIHGILALVPNICKKERYRQLALAEFIKLDFLELVDLLQNHDLPFVPIKGILLSQMLYGDFAVRPGSDIDIAMPLEKHREALEVLISNGYTHHQDSYLDRTVEVFSCRQNNTTLEVHFTLSTAERFSGFLTEFYHHQQEFELENRKLFLPSKEVYLAYLLIHLARHLDNSKVIWIEDIHRYLHRFGSEVDWEFFLQLGKNHRIVNALIISLKFCQGIFLTYGLQMPFPKRVLIRLESMQTLEGKILCHYAVPRLDRKLATPTVKRLYSFALCEDWRDRLIVMKGFLARRLPFS